MESEQINEEAWWASARFWSEANPNAICTLDHRANESSLSALKDLVEGGVAKILVQVDCYSLLELAVDSYSLAVVEALINYQGANKPNDYAITRALNHAVDMSQWDIIRYLKNKWLVAIMSLPVVIQLVLS